MDGTYIYVLQTFLLRKIYCLNIRKEITKHIQKILIERQKDRLNEENQNLIGCFYNLGENIFGLFRVLAQSLFTASEMELDYYH